MNNDTNISYAKTLLEQNHLVGFPTETVYGLGANAHNEQAVSLIFTTKSRPEFNPLIIHVYDLEQAKIYGKFNISATLLAKTFWAGALTLVVPKQENAPICSLANAGLDSIALRVPSHPIAQKLLRTLPFSLAAPSANLSGYLSPTSYAHVKKSLEDVFVIDGGKTTFGLESTIISCLEETPILLRKGSLSRDDIESVIKKPLPDLPEHSDKNARLAPGRLAKHYAPKAKLRLNATHIDNDESLLAFGNKLPDYPSAMINLSKTGNLPEAATNLFSALHELEEVSDKIAIMPIPNHGLGEAINDRLQRAAK